MKEKIKLKKERQLDNEYIIIYAIKNKIKVKYDDKIIDKNLYTLMGINKLGERTIIDIKIEREQDNHFWLDLLESWKKRGLESICMLSIIPNNNLVRAMKVVYPTGVIVPSMVSIINSIYRYVGGNHGVNSFIKLLKAPLIQETIEEGNLQLEMFKENYSNNLIVMKLIEKNFEQLEQYYKDYDDVVRNLIFNHCKPLEIFDKIKLTIYDKEYITSDNEIWENIYDYIENIEKNKTYTKKEWSNTINHIIKYFPKILESTIKE